MYGEKLNEVDIKNKKRAAADTDTGTDSNALMDRLPVALLRPPPGAGAGPGSTAPLFFDELPSMSLVEMDGLVIRR